MLEVYEGIPEEGDYTQGATAEDWGIEDDTVQSKDKNESNYTKTSELGFRGLTRLSTGGENGRIFHGMPVAFDPNINIVKRVQINQFFRAVLCQKISYEETNRFLDQFRYMIVGSSLLQKEPIFKRFINSPNKRRHDLLFDTRDPCVHLYVAPVCNIAANGGLIAMGLALHAKFRSASSKIERYTVCFVISMVLLVYYFATSKRSLLRSLRRKALIFIETFINTSKMFNRDFASAICDIQDVDVVSAGFISPYTVPGSLSTQNGTLQPSMSSNLGACKKLKAVCCSAIILAKEALLDATRDVMGMPYESKTPEQLFEIYELREDIQELGFEMNSDIFGFVDDEVSNEGLTGSSACYCSASVLKREFRKVNVLRRIFLSFLLAVDSKGNPDIEELEKWTIICDHLLECSKLFQQLSKMVSTERFYQVKDSFTSKDPKEALIYNDKDMKSHNDRKIALRDITSAAKVVTARLGILNDSEAPINVVNEQIDAITKELEDLKLKWQDFNKKDHMARDKDNTKPQSSSQDAKSPTLVMTPGPKNLGFELQSEQSSPDLSSTAYSTSASSSQTISFEGESSLPAFSKAHISRDERIKHMKYKKMIAHENSKILSQRHSLIQELDSAIRVRGKNSQC